MLFNGKKKQKRKKNVEARSRDQCPANRPRNARPVWGTSVVRRVETYNYHSET